MLHPDYSQVFAIAIRKATNIISISGELIYPNAFHLCHSYMLRMSRYSDQYYPEKGYSA